MFKLPSRRVLLVVWLGIAALAMNVLAGTTHLSLGSLSASEAAASGVLEICTPRGIVRIDAQTLAPIEAPAGEHSAATPCCDLCGTSCGAAVAATAVPVLELAPGTADTRRPSGDVAAPHPHPALTPLVPRGPPAHS